MNSIEEPVPIVWVWTNLVNNFTFGGHGGCTVHWLCWARAQRCQRVTISCRIDSISEDRQWGPLIRLIKRDDDDGYRQSPSFLQNLPNERCAFCFQVGDIFHLVVFFVSFLVPVVKHGFSHFMFDGCRLLAPCFDLELWLHVLASLQLTVTYAFADS